MILKSFIKMTALVSFMCAVALGPAVAQNIFLSPNKASAEREGDSQKKGRIFLSPNRLSDEANEPVIKYRDKLVVKAMRKKALEKIKTLEEWEAEGLEPQNMAERMMYAQAKRAVSQKVMYERRQGLMAEIEKEHRAVRARLASEAKAALKTDGSGGKTQIDTRIETERAKAQEKLEALEAAKPALTAAQAAQLAAQEEAAKRQSRSVKNKRSSWLSVFKKDKTAASDSSSASGEKKKSRVFTNF